MMNYMLKKMGIVLLLSSCYACTGDTASETPFSASEQVATILQIPISTPSSEKLSTLINMVRTGNRDSVAVLIRDNMAEFLQQIPLDEHTDNLMEFHNGFSQIEFNRYARNEAHHAIGLFYNTQSDKWVHIGVEVEKEPPHRIYLISIEPAAAPAD